MTISSIPRLIGRALGKHFTYRELAELLRVQHGLSAVQKHKYKEHLDQCSVCWGKWNHVRWDAAWTKRGTQELAEYLGADFEKYLDSSWALAYEWYSCNPQTKEEIELFYKKTKYYMYNSVIFYESGDRKNFKPLLEKITQANQIKSVLDYGSGAGNDGLDMIEMGMRVFFADLDSPTSDFLRWRLSKRKISNAKRLFYPVFAGQNYPSADMIWMVDVMEHMYDPRDTLKTISDKTRLFVYFTDEDDKAGGRHPFHLKIRTEHIEPSLKKRHFAKIEQDGLTIWQRK